VLQALGVIGQRNAPVEERSVPARQATEPARPASRPAPAATPATAPIEIRSPEPARTAPIAPEPRIAAAEPPRAFPSSESRSAPIPVDAPRTAAGTADATGEAVGKEDVLRMGNADGGRGATRSMPVLRSDASDDASHARRTVTEALPRFAAQAFADAWPVLSLAAVAEQPSQSSAVREAAFAAWRSERQFIAVTTDAGRARRLHDDARQALAAGRDSDALDIAWRAFAADPRNADIAGFLAYLNLRVHPAQAEIARQLALHALAMSGSRRTMRIDQWNTLAIASALTGRESDATRAMLVGLALAPDVDHACRAAVAAYTTYGGPLYAPVQAVLRRTQAQGRAADAPGCAWPSYRIAQRMN
jgi:hypothetical protein